ncbi:glycosyltransferase family protein [Mucilaginibacter mallensis]|nr:hypothetical protein [Mucilaginibacter mallensis]
MRLLFIGAVLLYIFTAINSSGYFHPDEHYQIIEFAELKAGNNTRGDLAWEYNAEIRPAIQPTLCYIIFRVCRAIGINDPYCLAMVLRLITAGFSLLTISLFAKFNKKSLPYKYQLTYLLLTYFIWFIPFVNVRYSSESWAGLLFMQAIIVFNSKIRFKYFFMGCVLGFSFLFRFQTALMALGWVSWIFMYHKAERKSLPYSIIGILVIIILGSFIDQWFYGNYVLTFVNYFKINVIQGVASLFGVSPWYYYFTEIVTNSIIPIGFCLLISLVALIILKPQNMLVWIIVPFLIGHILIPHKELRFLFPVINFIPLLVISGFIMINEKFSVSFQNKSVRIGSAVIFCIILFFNGIGLVINLTASSGNGSEKLTQYIDQTFKNRHVNLLYILYTNPYQPFYPLKQGFYQNKNVQSHQIQKLMDIKEQLSKLNINLFVASKADVDVPDLKEKLAELGFKVVKQSIPQWIINIKNCFRYGLTDDTLILYQLPVKNN